MKIKMLKIKLKSLAEESRIIRQQENKCGGKNWGYIRESLQSHRINVVRFESRATHIAYGFLRGRRYHQIESSCHDIGITLDKILWDKVESMVKKYGNTSLASQLKDWRKGNLKKAA